MLSSSEGGRGVREQLSRQLSQVNEGNKTNLTTLDAMAASWRVSLVLLIKTDHLFSGHGSELLGFPGLCSTQPIPQ